MESKIIYAIHAFNKPDQVARLINRLNTPGVIFILNIDLKSDASLFPQAANIFYVEDRQRVCVSWGGISQVKQTIETLRLIKKLNFTGYSHVVFLSEYCYPIKNIAKLEKYLTLNRHKSFVLHYKIDQNSNWRIPIDRLNSFNINDLIKFDRGKIWHKWIIHIYTKYIAKYIKLNLISEDGRILKFNNYQLYAGSNWCIFNEISVNYIVNFLDQFGSSYMNIFKYSRCPDESFFHTILLNSPLAESINKNHHRYIDWSDKNEWPRFLREQDLATLIKKSKSNSLFGRKFDNNKCNKILDLIDANLLERS